MLRPIFFYFFLKENRLRLSDIEFLKKHHLWENSISFLNQIHNRDPTPCLKKNRKGYPSAEEMFKTFSEPLRLTIPAYINVKDGGSGTFEAEIDLKKYETFNNLHRVGPQVMEKQLSNPILTIMGAHFYLIAIVSSTLIENFYKEVVIPGRLLTNSKIETFLLENCDGSAVPDEPKKCDDYFWLFMQNAKFPLASENTFFGAAVIATLTWFECPAYETDCGALPITVLVHTILLLVNESGVKDTSSHDFCLFATVYQSFSSFVFFSRKDGLASGLAKLCELRNSIKEYNVVMALFENKNVFVDIMRFKGHMAAWRGIETSDNGHPTGSIFDTKTDFDNNSRDRDAKVCAFFLGWNAERNPKVIREKALSFFELYKAHITEKQKSYVLSARWMQYFSSLPVDEKILKNMEGENNKDVVMKALFDTFERMLLTMVDLTLQKMDRNCIVYHEM